MWKKTHFVIAKNDEELFGPEISYLNATGALMCLANCICATIVFFFVNLLARYSSTPTRRHWNGIKHILRYLRGTTDMGLFYSRESKQQLLGYADAGYLSDPYKCTHELQKKCEIDVQQIRSLNNIADLFIKALPSTTLKKLRYDIGMRKLRDLPFEMLKKS